MSQWGGGEGECLEHCLKQKSVNAKSYDQSKFVLVLLHFHKRLQVRSSDIALQKCQWNPTSCRVHRSLKPQRTDLIGSDTLSCCLTCDLKGSNGGC
eukprot:3795663-Amphidinium_carterae.1